MQVETFYYNKVDGWSCQRFPNLDSSQTLVLFFAAKEYIDSQGPINELVEFYPNSEIMGCSTAGEIYQENVLDHHIVVSVIKFIDSHIKLVHDVISDEKDSYNIGKNIIEKLFDKPLKSIFVLSDGIHVNGSNFVAGLTENCTNEIVISGGLAGDGSEFKQTWTFSKKLGFSIAGIVAVGLYGSTLRLSYGYAGGWDTFGPERVITKSKDNVLYRLDNQPALPLYKLYLGEQAKELPASALLFPMAIRNPDSDKLKIVRTILGIDDKTESLTFAGNMPEGWYAQLMTSNSQRLLNSVSNAGKQSLENIKVIDENSILLSIAISCVGRRMVLGENTEEELEVLMDLYPEKTKQIGFYSYGELSPSKYKSCELHNQTMTVTLIKTERK